MRPCDSLSLSRYLDGEMLLPDLLDFERHLAGCEGCRVEIETLRALDRKVQNWGRGRFPVPGHVEARLRRSVDKRRRFAPILALGRMMPAAVGSCIAALLVALTANLGTFQVSRSTPSATPHVSKALVSQSSRLSNARRATAILGGHMSTVQQDTPLRHRVQLDVQ